MAERRGFESLVLDLSNNSCNFRRTLGPTLETVFNCRNLVVLKLKAILIREDVVPQFHFPLLKTLHLNNIVFFGHFNKLIEGCPVVDDLQITDLLLGSTNEGNGEFKRLSDLVKVNVSNLQRGSQLLDGGFEMHKQQCHTFRNLTHLELGLIFASNWHTNLNCLIEVLRDCPKLENLTLHEFDGHGVGDDMCKKPQNVLVPECLSSQLKTCTLIGYKGTYAGIQFIAYILKNAKLLNTVTIKASQGDLNIRHQTLMRLLWCPRCAPTCRILFVEEGSAQVWVG